MTTCGADKVFEKLSVRRGISIDIESMDLRQFGPLVRMGAIIFGGIVTMNLASTVTLKALRFASEKKRVKIG